MSRFEALRSFALAFPGAYPDHPWGEDETVYKTAKGKMFVVCSEDEAAILHATVKLTPDESVAALTLPFVSVARYVGRYGWVTAHIKDDTELEITLEWVARSHEIVSRGGARRR
ncbi:MAG: MmcQ/YjbR family DNA-binding protein [Tepidiformaceae bacterium]